MPFPLDPSKSSLMQRLLPWQPAPAEPATDERRREPPRHTVSLEDFDPGAKPFSLGDKAQDKAAVEDLAVELDGLQNLFYADKRYKLLVVLQGRD